MNKATQTRKKTTATRSSTPRAAKAAAPKKKAVKKTAETVAAQPEQFAARARYVNYSPYKLRPVANVVRGKDVPYALNWLQTYRTQRATAIKKLLESAVANAKNLKNVEAAALIVKDIRVDHGPIHRYFKPGAQGRAQIQRKRLCHISLTLQTVVQKG